MSDIFKILLLLSLCLPQTAFAVELFGVKLENTSRDELRSAAKEAGLLLVHEADEDEAYDIYDSSGVVGGSMRLYLGFVTADQGFAFAEYDFRGNDAKPLLKTLTVKYGDPEMLAGPYMSDRIYRWLRDGIEIKLSSDWQNYRIRLSYINYDNLVKLQAEQLDVVANIEENTGFSLF